MTMSLNAGDRRLALATGVTDDGVTIFAPFEGKCTPLAAGDRRVGIVTGVTDDGTPVVVAWGQQKCKPGTTKWEAGKRYLGVVTGVTDDGVPIIGSWCEDCPENDQTFCGCTICCELEASVQFPIAPVFPDVTAEFGDAINTTLTCGRSFVVTHYFACNDEELEQTVTAWDQTWEGGEGTDNWENGTYDWRTVVWVSDEEESADLADQLLLAGFITATGKFKLFFAATEYIYHEEGEDEVYCCAYEWGVLFEYMFVEPFTYANIPSWGFWFKNGTSTGSCAVRYVMTEYEYQDNDNCPPDYTFGGDMFDDGSYLSHVCQIDAGGPPYLGSISQVAGCITGTGSDPLNIFEERWTTAVADDPDCEDHNKCVRLSIIDQCGQLPCSLMESLGGMDITLDYEVAACYAASDSDVEWTGAACSESCLFNAGTANIFAGADTSFDPTDVEGPVILFQWCDAEFTYWVDTEDVKGLIEFAFCCVEREDGSTYLAFYALLTLTCYESGSPVSTTQFAYKTRDLAIEPGNPSAISFTGLTPFASTSTDPACPCDPPELSLALIFTGACP